MQPTTQHQEDAMPYNPTTALLEDAATEAHRLMQAERTLESEALQSNWYEPIRRQHRAASDREADRLHAIGPAGREAERQAAYHSTF